MNRCPNCNSPYKMNRQRCWYCGCVDTRTVRVNAETLRRLRMEGVVRMVKAQLWR